MDLRGFKQVEKRRVPDHSQLIAALKGFSQKGHNLDQNDHLNCYKVPQNYSY